MRIEIISGSPRHNSVTRRVAVFLQHMFRQKTGFDTGLISLHEYDIPPVQQVWSSPEKAPEHLRSLAGRVFAADAFVLVTPEYNGSYAPALKNLLDHFPKQVHKAFGIVTASPGAMGGIRASQQLLLLVPALFGIASPQMLIVPQVDKKFDAEGRLTEPAFQSSVDNFVAEFSWLASALKPQWQEA